MLSPVSSPSLATSSLASSAGWEWEEVLSPSPVGFSPSLVDSSPALAAVKKEEEQLMLPVELELRFEAEEEIPVEILSLSPAMAPQHSPLVNGAHMPPASWDRLLDLPSHSSYRLHREYFHSSLSILL
jgi:hypothetical protein